MSPPTVAPDWAALAWASIPLALSMALLAWRRLGQVTPMAIAVTRLVVQLWLLGIVLKAIFRADSPWVVLATSAVMLAVAAHTVGARQPASRWLIRAEALFAMTMSIAVTMAISVTLALRLHPWYSPATFIPLFGMILGNSVTSVSLAAERLSSELKADRDLVEQRLALGATSRQAAMPALRSAVRASLTPIINNMSIAGIVAIPGMTAGQLLAGADVGAAMRYQVLVYLGITATATISTLILLGLRLRHYFTAAHQLREG
jgi:putative ABC transport system permease protein